MMRALAGFGVASALLLQHGTDAPLGNVSMAMQGGPKPWQSKLHEEGSLLDPLYEKLSPDCRTHYEAMHNGEKEDTAMVKMGDKEGCAKIGGKVCKTEAKLTGTKTTRRDALRS